MSSTRRPLGSPRIRPVPPFFSGWLVPRRRAPLDRFRPADPRGPFAAANRCETSTTNALGLAALGRPGSLAGRGLGTFSRAPGAGFAFFHASGIEPGTSALRPIARHKLHKPTSARRPIAPTAFGRRNTTRRLSGPGAARDQSVRSELVGSRPPEPLGTGERPRLRTSDLSPSLHPFPLDRSVAGRGGSASPALRRPARRVGQRYPLSRTRPCRRGHPPTLRPEEPLRGAGWECVDGPLARRGSMVGPPPSRRFPDAFLMAPRRHSQSAGTRERRAALRDIKKNPRPNCQTARRRNRPEDAASPWRLRFPTYAYQKAGGQHR